MLEIEEPSPVLLDVMLPSLDTVKMVQNPDLDFPQVPVRPLRDHVVLQLVSLLVVDVLISLSLRLVFNTISSSPRGRCGPELEVWL